LRMSSDRLNRRQFMAAGAAAGLQLQAQPPKKRIAAVITMYTQDGGFYSHASVIVGRLLEGYSPNGVFTQPRTQLVSMYTAQVPPTDRSRGLAQKYGFTIYPTIKETLTLGGADLAVDGVCFIGEHGNYPYNDRGQHLYPRYELMEPIVEVFRRTGKTVPVFADKHFSYSWSKAKQMYGWSRELKFPLIAGSSIPLTVRTPLLEIPYEAHVESAVALGYGELDAYGFHTLEALQCMIERRKGGETGIRAVEWIEGDAVWQWRDGEGKWSIPLLKAALARNRSTKSGRMQDHVKSPAAFVLHYLDGTRAVAYMLDGYVSAWSFAAAIKDKTEPVATYFEQGDAPGSRPFPHFDALVHCMEEMFITGKPLYPVERTLLTTCALSMLFESRAWKRRIESNELKISYRAPRDTYFQRV
jgi:hypothetical protein